MEEDDLAAAASPLSPGGVLSRPVQGSAHASAAASSSSTHSINGAAATARPAYTQVAVDDDEESNAAGDGAVGYSEVEFSSDDEGTSVAYIKRHGLRAGMGA